MKKNAIIGCFCLAALSLTAATVAAQKENGPKRNVIDEVAWIVGDNAIYKSEIEDQYAQMRSQGISRAETRTA